MSSRTYLFTGAVLAAAVISGFFIFSARAAQNQAPAGWLDAADCVSLRGWAYDPDTPNDAIAIHFYDGLTTFLTAGYTTEDRPDVNNGLGVSGTHGYTVAIPDSLKDGQPHVIYAYGIDSDPSHSMNALLAGSPKTIQCLPTATAPPVPPPVLNPTPTPTPAPTNHAPSGFLDTVSCEKIEGWAYDTDTPNDSIAIHFYDGPTTFLTDTYTTINRPDVNGPLNISGTHGYALDFPTSLKDGHVHTIYAYGIDSDPAHSMNALLAGSPKTIACNPDGSVVTPTPAPSQTPAPQQTSTPAPGITITPGPTISTPPASGPKAADINKDGRIDGNDVNILVNNFGRTGTNSADLNGDGLVDIFDWNILVETYGE